MRFLSSAFFIAALLMALAWSSPARADASKWIVTRSPEASTCSDGPALASEFADAREGQGRMPEEVEVAFDRVGGAFTATVHIRGRSAGSRLLSDASTSCAALSDAVVATLLVLVDESESAPPLARAPTPAEIPPAAPKEPKEFSSLRLGLAVSFAPIVEFHRTSTEPLTYPGFGVSAEMRLYNYSRHGVTGGYTVASGVFGPNVQIFHAAYSYALVEPHPLDGVSWAAYIDLGPAFGIVKDVLPAPDHTALGGHAAVDLDVLIWNVTLGISARYDGGVPLGGASDAWEGALSVLGRAGLLFDFGEQRGQRR